MRVGIVGSGPAGLFCADRLIQHGIDVTIYEAGSAIEDRKCPQTKECDCKVCHILEGEGGAGGLSDGKNTYSLSRGTQLETDLFPLVEGQKELQHIDDMTIKYGGLGRFYHAKEPVKISPTLIFQSYPLRHLGSDGIQRFIYNFSQDLQRRGVVLNLRTSGQINVSNRLVNDISYGDGAEAFDAYVLASGLQGIPEIESLMKHLGSPLGSGAAGFGIRVEAPAHSLEKLHKKFYDFKIIHELDEFITRSFCCNHEGYVVNENHRTLPVRNVNGHSFLDKTMRTQSSNFAIILKVPESKFADPQDLVRRCGQAINSAAGGCTAYEPLPQFIDLDWQSDTAYMTNSQAVKVDIGKILIEFGIYWPFYSFITELGKIAPIINPFSTVYAPEIKYFGRRVNISKEWKSKDVDNLYIVGSATGYLDSFVSAALSGILAANNIVKEITRNGKS